MADINKLLYEYPEKIKLDRSLLNKAENRMDELIAEKRLTKGKPLVLRLIYSSAAIFLLVIFEMFAYTSSLNNDDMVYFTDIDFYFQQIDSLPSYDNIKINLNSFTNIKYFLCKFKNNEEIAYVQINSNDIGNGDSIKINILLDEKVVGHFEDYASLPEKIDNVNYSEKLIKGYYVTYVSVNYEGLIYLIELRSINPGQIQNYIDLLFS